MMKIKSLLIFTLLISVLGFAQTPIHRFTFDNTYWNNSSTVKFANLGNANSYFQPGRNGGQSIKIPSGNSLYTSFSNLPLNASARSIAVWIKFDSFLSKNYIFSYGTSSTSNCFGLTLNNSGEFEQYNWGSGYSIFGYLSALLNTTNWYHLVTVYDGTKVKMYIDGVLFKSQNLTINTLNGYFKIGETPSISSVPSLDARIDDLQIYDVALTDAQVNSLFNGTLATSESSKTENQISIYPNPAKDVFFVKYETPIANIELYDFLGKKLKESTSKKMNISSLQRGNYLVKITDKEGNTQTKNLIKE